MKNRTPLPCREISHVLVLLAALTVATALGDVVTHDIGDPESNLWKEGEWVTASGGIEVLDDCPSDPSAVQGAKTLRLVVHYGARSFGGWNAERADKEIPGRPVMLTGWSRKGNDKSWGMEAKFKDANKHEFSLAIPAKSMDWERFEIRFPEKVKGKDPETGKDAQMPIAFPVRFESINQNNWGDRNNPEAVDRILDLYDLRVHTDMEGIPVEERPYSFALSFPATANCFYYGEEEPKMVLSVGSWLGEERVVHAEVEVESASGGKKPLPVPDFSVLDGASKTVPLPFTEPGAYIVRLRATGLPGDAIERSARYAVILHPPALTEEQKWRSPYGINVHGGTHVGYEKFARLGFAWVRDYAFNYSWMVRARGDGAYAGWPWYPKIFKAAADNGLLTLPCLMTAIPANAESDPEKPNAPTLEWRRNIALIVSTFPEQRCWELDNEREGTMNDSYGAYHRVFAEILKACRPDALSVQEGCAGIHLAATRKHVLSGAFKDLDVVNGHRYSGMVGPEVSRQNLNPGQGEEKKMYQRDLWRQWKLASELDGRPRQRWLTEWGWDTRAGQIVSEWEQASYMQREWVLAMGNGIDKLFWYWYYDSDTDKPMNFFDGCGMFDRFREPKPVAAAFAALRTFLPTDMEYLGYANLGPNHMAHMLRRADGKLVALAFQLYPAEKATMLAPEVRELTIRDPKSERVCDMFGAELAPTDRRKLDIAPVWYIGLDPGCDWLKQCPIDLGYESESFVQNVSGEPIPLHLENLGKVRYRVDLPEAMAAAGWTVEEREYGYDVTGPLGAERTSGQFTVVGENEGVEKRMPIDVDVIPQAYAKSHVERFGRTFSVEVVNQSSKAQTFELRANLPEGWQVEPANQRTKELEPGAADTLTFTLVESSAIPATEKTAIPKLDIVNVSEPRMEGMVIDYAPIVPRGWTMHRVRPGQISIDGDPADWEKDAAKYQLPNWMLGPRGDKETSRLYMAYDDGGLYLMADIDDSQCKTSDPNSFWRAADCLELMFSSPGAGFADGRKWGLDDHQFWFCPMPLENRVFAGFWSNCEGQKGLSDITPEQGIRSALSTVKDAAGDTTGYRMEIFIGKDRLHGWNPQEGADVGMMFTIAAQGLRDPREIYWPSPKRGDMAVKKPWMWAKVRLGE